MKKKYILITLISLIIVLSIGITYALFYSSVTQSDLNALNTTCFDVTYTENSNSINLVNSYPMKDSKGLKLKPYTFTITNTCNTTSEYVVTVNTTNNSSTILLPYIKIANYKTNIRKLNSLRTINLSSNLNTIYNINTSYEIDTGYLEQNESKSYSINLWIDESAGNNIMGESFEARVIVTNLANSTSPNDVTLAVKLQDKENNLWVDNYTNTTSFPSKTSGYTYQDIKCDDESVLVTAQWDETNYTFSDLRFRGISQPIKCIVNFGELTRVEITEDIVVDIDSNMIPIVYDESTSEWKKANPKSGWCNYDTKQWCNAVTIVPSELATYKAMSVSETIDNDDVMGYYVYIPRYRYTLWNVNADGAQTSNEQEIIIDFENKETTAKSNGYTNGSQLTHPAFTLGTRELNGFWIGKFETSTETNYEAATTSATALQNGVYVKPYLSSTSIQYSLWWMNIYNQYLTAVSISGSNYHNLSSSTESGMLKNSQWGSVAYLSHSIYGTCNGTKGSATCTEVGLNSHLEGYTGVGPQASGEYSTSGAIINIYSSEIGLEASTTKTIYGVYDMSGGAYEYVMGVMKAEGSNEPLYSNSGFTAVNLPTKEYYDLYDYGTAYNDSSAYARGHLGDATKEIIKSVSNYDGWYSDYTIVVNASSPWFGRGGYSYSISSAGVFLFSSYYGSAISGGSFRIFLAKK